MHVIYSEYTAEPPRRIDHRKHRVRRDVGMGMESCLSRSPKERTTIPVGLAEPWLGLPICNAPLLDWPFESLALAGA